MLRFTVEISLALTSLNWFIIVSIIQNVSPYNFFPFVSLTV